MAEAPGPFDADWIVVGSGFGGSVAALRLAEKGYRVVVLEQGKRWRPEDHPKTNWNPRKFLWAPKLLCHGIQALTLLDDVFVLHGAGVGGGSLVYANTLLVPPDEVFAGAAWSRLGDWKRELAPHYETAKRMLGVVPVKEIGEADRLLREVAVDMGRGATFRTTDVGVFFGEPEKEVPDPYFGGEGPARTGCTLCGGCMTGCRVGAKNTLDRNYLFLAERLGVRIVPETKVEGVFALAEGGYELRTRRATSLFPGRRRWRARGVVFAAGVLGTVPLLARSRAAGGLPNVSGHLGHFVRTNSEALVGVATRRPGADWSKGVAIASGFHPDEKTHVEMVRYGEGQDAMSMLATPMVDGGPARPLRWLATLLRHPLRFARTLPGRGWAKRTGILLVMQPVDNHLRLELARRWWWPFGRSLVSRWETSDPVPKWHPVAHEVARRLAEKSDGDPVSVLPEVVLDLASTAHILGGCPMGRDASEGVVDRDGRLFGHENLLVADGSIVPGNLSVNPSLTITALAERVMAAVPAKG